MGKVLRRSFLIGTAAIAGGVAFGIYKLRQPYSNPLEGQTAEGEETFNPYLKITRDNKITIMIPRAEMGQGVSTTLTALVAEELDVSMGQVAVEIAPASYAYYNSAMLADGAPLAHYNRKTMAEITRSAMGVAGKVLGLQVTGGSSSIADAYEKLRHAGAAARETLKLAAYKSTGIAVKDMKTEDGMVILPDGKALTYGALAQVAATLDPPADLELRPDSEWKILGKSTPRTDALAKSTGAGIFAIDVDLPDMVYATLRMNPRLGGPMISFDATQAKKVRDVIDVIDLTGPEDEAFGGGFAVIATNTWAAIQGAEAVEVEWGPAAYPADTDGIMKLIDEALKTGEGDEMRNEGDVDLAFADAPRDSIAEARYQVPYLAHATMEPMNATAQLKNGRLDIWVGTQAPTIVRSDCAAEAGVDEEDTFIHSTYLGGGFGRRGEVDFARFTTRVAKTTGGKPVKLVWTREEDMTHDAYRPASMSHWRALLDKEGYPTAIDARIAAPSPVASILKRIYPSLSPMGPDSSITQGAFDQPYTVGDYRVSGIKAAVDIPVGFWRSVGNSYNGFYHESFIDELAARSAIDPLNYRLKLMKDHPTAIGVVNKVAEMSNWSSPKEDGRAKGLAFTLSFGCWVAQVVEVAQTDDGIRITNVWCAADIGQALDPAIVKTQLQSGIVFGLSSAIGQEITFDDGMVDQQNFDSFDAMRMNQCPKIHVELLETAAHRGGAGEPGTPPSIPALANAIFALTGQRIRSMPLSNEVDFHS